MKFALQFEMFTCPLSKGSELCGNNSMNPETHICCQDNLLLREFENAACCGQIVYNAKDELCCLDGSIAVVSKRAL